MSEKTYTVTVSFDPTWKNGQGGGGWVARDDENKWRAYCDKHFATTATQAVAMMFHACEVASVGNETNGSVSVEIYE